MSLLKVDNCANCRYWDGNRENEASFGTCHFNPPVVMGLLPQKNLAGQEGVAPICGMPTIQGKSWCSKFNMK